MYNKKALRYPRFTDSHANKVMSEPARTDWAVVDESKRVKWGSTERSNYIKEYEKKHGKPSFNWSDMEIHHIKPRKYGGTNDFDNLIPLTKNFHRQTVNVWWTNY